MNSQIIVRIIGLCNIPTRLTRKLDIAVFFRFGGQMFDKHVYVFSHDLVFILIEE